MKRLLLISGVVLLFLSGCKIYPDADFSVNATRVQPDEVVRFTNYSNNAVYYEWDFGDGYISNAVNPTHYYTDEGIYTVTLTAESKDGKRDRAVITIEVIYTLLEITVAEWNPSEVIRFVVPNALVIAYNNLNDWLDDVNEVVWGYSDRYGTITFAGLENRRYYIWVEARDVYHLGDGYDNYQFYLDYMDSYLMTPILVPFALNTWVAWVDYYNVYKSASAVERKFEKYSKDKIKSDNPSFIKVDVSK